MRTIIQTVLSEYNRIVYDLADERVFDYYFLFTPWPTMVALVSYWCFVFKIGPALMANKKPLKLDRIIQIYDVIQVVLCAHFAITSTKLVLSNPEKNIFCLSIDYTRSELGMSMVALGHVYYLLKILDLMDTVFIVLRKKNTQLTFLHLFHHSVMVILSWVFMRYFPGGTNSVVPIINCQIHAIMYSYYFITNFWPETRSNLWWKKNITQLQILQFFIIGLAYLITLLRDCNFPKSNAYVGLTGSFAIAALFFNFYWQAYIRPKKQNKLKCT